MYIDASKINKNKGAGDMDFVNMEKVSNIKNNVPEVNSIFYEKYNPQIRAIVAKILYYSNQESYIDDCVNDVYVKLIEKLQQYNETCGSIAAFIAIIARSTALDYCRTNKRKIDKLSGDEKLDFLIDPVKIEDTVGFEMLVESITKNLNSRERIIFTMRYVYYFTPEEIAKEFNIPVSTAYKRISRLKDKIKNSLIKGGFNL
jgi:RNA polymerase sigma-70 factor (ECF subfamily)